MTTGLRVLEATYWILAVTAMITVGLGILALAGNGLLTLKYLLFVVGFLLFGIGAWALWAGSRKRPTIWPEVSIGPDVDDAVWFERRLWDLPGLRGEWLPVHERVSRPIKLFLTGLAVLAISFVMEAVFGIAV